MTMTGGYSGMPDRQDMISLLHRAVGLGATFFDTAEIYGPHANEELVGEALATYADQVVPGTAARAGATLVADTGPSTGTERTLPVRRVLVWAEGTRLGLRRSS